MSGERKSGLGGLFGKESQAGFDVYLNLTSLMDVMSNILFFLLAAFGVSTIAILPTTVPIQTSEGNDVAESTDKVTVMLRADAAALNVTCESATIPHDVLDTFGANIPKKAGKYDGTTLTMTLKKIKEKYPASLTMILVPDDNIKYEVIVYLMDSAREWKKPDGKKMTLFPEVVMSSLYTGDVPTPAPAGP
jgi:biopolymer transport protein ExbD